MYIFKNAFISITRNKGRNLLIGVIVIVISCATAISLAIRNSADRLITSYQNQYETTATIGINRESMRNEMKMDGTITEDDRKLNKENMQNIFSEVANISVEDIEKYGNSDYVKNYYYQISVGVNATGMEKVSQTDNDSSNFGRGGKENFQNTSTSDFTLVGYSSVSAMEDFISGKYKIVDGEVSDDLDSNYCVINSELATLNNIQVGDQITIVDPDHSDYTMILTVSGIYEEDSDQEDAMGMFSSSANMMITSSNTVNQFISKDENMKRSITPTFVLTSKDVVDSFSKELTEKGLSEYLVLSTNLDQVEEATSTISNTKTFATTFLIITLIIGSIVLFVINMINIRERRYEIGVLRTIGMKKSLLALQFVNELLMVTIISLFIGTAIGASLSVPVSNHLLQNQISKQTEEKNTINQNFGGNKKDRFNSINGVTNVEVFDSIDAVVDFKVLGQLFVIGIVLTLVSSTASMISIQRFSPLTILKERS